MSSTEGALAGRSSRVIEARKGERRAVALPPTGPAGISVIALADVVASPGFWGLSVPRNLGAIGLRSGWGTWAVASRAVIRSQRRGEGLEHEPQVSQVNPVPVAGVR